ncbi:MAG: hypothetical protein U0520_00925 [Candidatus Saccharimonadales bacterium]
MYLAKPPLYGIGKNQKKIYAYDEDERERVMDEIIAEKGVVRLPECH